MIFLFPEAYKYEKKHNQFTFELGGYYIDRADRKIYQFIQSSPKGFNFVDVNNGRCHFKRQVNAVGDINRAKYITLTSNPRFFAYQITFFDSLRPLMKRTPISDILDMIKESKDI